MTVTLSDVHKVYPTKNGPVEILKGINLRVEPGEHVGILGQNGAGKSTLVKILGGSEMPTSGTVERNMSVSWPLAFSGAFLGALTGLDNVRFVCRLYGQDFSEKLPFIEEFTELGRYLREPLKTYSSGMRARLAFALSMAIDFDCYLIDEIVAVGDDRFQKKCQVELFDKRQHKALLIVSHSADFVRAHCHRASVLSAGELTNFGGVDDAYQFYAESQVAMQPHMAPSGTARRAILQPGAVDRLIGALDSHGIGQEFNSAVDREQIAAVPVLDACDVVGRLAGRGYVDAAQKLAHDLADLHPDEPLLAVTAGDLSAMQRQHVPAVKTYRRAIELDRGSFWAKRNLAIELFNTGRYADAEPLFRQAIHVAPSEQLRRELQLRLVDCCYLQDTPNRLTADDVSGSRSGITIYHASELSNGSARRLEVDGTIVEGLHGEPTCEFLVGDVIIQAEAALARGSTRRLAAVAENNAFAFRAYTDIDQAGPSSYRISSAGNVIAEGELTTTFIQPATIESESTYVERARSFHQRHVASEAILFFGLSDAAGSAVDIVDWAEDLIALGLYDEAEQLLERNFLAGTVEPAEREFVLDLLCVEIARSRLPGWMEKIAALLRSSDLKGSPSLPANLGHLSVARGDIKIAIGHYGDASRLAGDRPLIHFSRGIHSAAIADQEAIRSIRVEGDAPCSDGGIVHLFSCDAGYFNRFARKIVTSSRAKAGMADVIIHAHVIDPDADAVELAEALGRDFDLQTTFEHSPDYIETLGNRRAYYTCGRFIKAPELLAQYRRPILVTETDCLINWSWDDVIEHVGNADVGYVTSALWNWVPWTKVPAGICYISCSAKGATYAAFLKNYLVTAFEQLGAGHSDLWTVDQVGLWLAHASVAAEAKVASLPMSSVLTLATGDKLNI